MKHATKSLERVHQPQRRSDCPIHFALEIFGNRWLLLHVRDIVLFGKHTYGDFLRSKGLIATSVLAARLALLEREGILSTVRSEGKLDEGKQSQPFRDLATLPPA
jgi:DNA-binding HxlR family transcriptional regulator